jgi:hypothetical protein
MIRKLSGAILLLLISMMLLASGCERSVSPRKGSQINLGPYIWEILKSPRENKEAEEIALCLSDKLVAPENLYRTVLNHLTVIRAEYGDSIPQLKEITLRPNWVIGELLIMLTLEAREEVRRGEYHDLDFLNAHLKLAQMDTSSLGFVGYVRLIFEARLHPVHLMDLYNPVASIRYAQPNYWYGDRSNIYTSFSETGITYLFREAWGDCPSGCIYERFWCFEATHSGISYIGSWDPALESEPDWWGKCK